MLTMRINPMGLRDGALLGEFKGKALKIKHRRGTYIVVGLADNETNQDGIWFKVALRRRDGTAAAKTITVPERDISVK